MKIKRKDLKILIEKYLLFEQEEEAEEEAPDEEAAAEEEEEPAEEEEEEEEPAEEEEEAEPEEASDKEDAIETSKVISNSLKGAVDALKNNKPLSALSVIKTQVETSLDGVEIKVKDLTDDIKKLLNFDKTPDEEIVNLKAAVNNAGIRRKALADEQEGIT